MQPQSHPEDIDFQKYWLILKRHWLPATLVWAATIAVATFKALSTDEIYQAHGKLRFTKDNATSALMTELGEEIGQLDSLNSQNTPLDTEAEVIRSVPLINQTIEQLSLTNEEGELISYEDFRNNLGIKSVTGTDVLMISYQNPDPLKSQLVVNTLIENYLENNIGINRTQAVAAREFISEQLPKTEVELQRAEAALREFKERNQLVNLEAEETGIVTQIGTLETQIDQVRSQLQKTTARMAELQQKTGVSAQEALQRNELKDSTGVQQVLTRLQEVESQLAEERGRFREANPVIVDLKQKKASLENLLQQRIGEVVNQSNISRDELQTGTLQAELSKQLVSSEVERQELLEQLEVLQQTKLAHQQRANAIPQLEQIQRGLERQVEAAQAAYEVLLNNFQQVQIAENQNVGNAQIISPAIVSEYPVSMSKRKTVAIGIIAGGVLYVITAFLLEMSDSSIKTSKDLRLLLNYTLLGMIPSSRWKAFLGTRVEEPIPERQVLDAPHSVISEAYRMLQANLKFLSPDRDLKVTVVTSSVPKEGKSTVSSNLAVAIAQLGSRVLLVDGDLHHPNQHHIWNLTNEIGLSDVIVNQADLNEVIKPIIPNLDILPSGAIPPNSLALLESKRMKELMEIFKQSYDYVIVDTPPLLLFADALTVGKIGDGILFVARPGVIDRVSVTTAKEQLQKSGQNVLGLVTNGISVDNEPDSYFHYAKSYYQGSTINNHVSPSHLKRLLARLRQ
ncbi:MAG: GumC family protein [Halothece sp.]